MPRETFIMEMNCEEPVGSDEAGQEKVKEFLKNQAKILGQKPLIEPVTHLSPKFGLSGWLPLEDSVIHLYAWDMENQPHEPFVSVDISTPAPLAEEVMNQLCRSTVEDLNAIEEEVVVKKKSDPPPPGEWTDLAPHIVRQRLSISAQTAEVIEDKSVSEYMSGLSKVLKMNQLSEPVIQGNTGWMHWETSGMIMSWDNDLQHLDMDIYTCKPFSPEDAIAYTRKKFKLLNLDSQNF